MTAGGWFSCSSEGSLGPPSFAEGGLILMKGPLLWGGGAAHKVVSLWGLR